MAYTGGEIVDLTTGALVDSTIANTTIVGSDTYARRLNVSGAEVTVTDLKVSSGGNTQAGLTNPHGGRIGILTQDAKVVSVTPDDLPQYQGIFIFTSTGGQKEMGSLYLGAHYEFGEATQYADRIRQQN